MTGTLVTLPFVTRTQFDELVSNWPEGVIKPEWPTSGDHVADLRVQLPEGEAAAAAMALLAELVMAPEQRKLDPTHAIAVDQANREFQAAMRQPVEAPTDDAIVDPVAA